MYRPLEGLRIIEFSKLIPGAAVGHYFADLGADVVKVEVPPVGDYLREVQPFIDGLSLQHLTLDRGKRSAAIDTTRPDGRHVLHALIRSADAMVVVSPQAALELHGADWPTVREQNPDLVYLSFTGFGLDSPYSELPTHGANLAAFASVHGVAERHDGVLVPAPLPQGRYRIPMEQASLYAAFQLLAALQEARRTGHGRIIDLAITHALMLGDYAAITDVLANGRSHVVEQVQPSTRYSIYRAGDDKLLVVCPIERRFWLRFCGAIGRPDLEDRGDWSASQFDFGAGDIELYHEVQSAVATHPRQHWLDRLVAVRVPCAPVNLVAEAIGDPAIGGRLWTEAKHPRTGRTFAWPTTGARPMDGFDPGPAPAMGQDTEDVLRTWSVDDDLVERARQEQAIS